jgi:hypothetical protein
VLIFLDHIDCNLLHYEPAGLDWITCLRAPAIQALAGGNGPLRRRNGGDEVFSDLSFAGPGFDPIRH